MMRPLVITVLMLAAAVHNGWASNQVKPVMPGAQAELAIPQEERPAALLPLQDRVGDSQLALMVAEEFRRVLSETTYLKDAALVRDTMRHLRVRNARDVPPALLETLFAELKAQWIFIPTLHAASEGLVPQVILSAQVFHSDQDELSWAGFRSTSGLERRQVLGRGIEIELAQVVQRAVRDLVEDFVKEHQISGAVECRLDRKMNKAGYRRQTLDAESLGRVGVVPFGAATGAQGSVHAEMITALAMAELHRHGVRLALPTLVSETMRQRRNLSPGELEGTSRIALLIGGKIDHIFTGMIEVFDSQGGIEPKPEVEFGARLLAAETGSILWMNGLAEDGWDHQRAFLTRRIYAGGRLAETLMHALVTGALSPAPVQAQDKGFQQ